MEGTNTELILYTPIRELSSVSLYFPKRRPPSFQYKSRASHSENPSDVRDRRKEDLAASGQKGQSSDCSVKLYNSQQATREAVAELRWLAAEHHQLLADLLSLCQDCAYKVSMGNQDGKPEDDVDPREVPPSSSRFTDQKRVASKTKKTRSKGGDSKDLLHSKTKRKVSKDASEVPSTANKAFNPKAAQARLIPKKSSSDQNRNNPATRSHVSTGILPMEEPSQMSRDNWDFMEDNRMLDPDFCTDFSECDGELGYQSSSCTLMEGLTRRESGSNLRPMRRFDSPVEGSSTTKSAKGGAGVRVVAKVQDVEGKVLRVGHASPNRTKPHQEKCCQESGKWRGSNKDDQLDVSKDKTPNKPSESLRLPLSYTTDPSGPGTSHPKSPSSSLAGVFNISFPASNSLQRMSPVLSPLSPNPQLNHRIVLLPDKDEEADADGSSCTEEGKIFTEITDKNGNKQTVARLDLNLSRRPSNSKWNSSSNSTTTEDSLLRQDDIWMFDDPQEPLSRVPRPDHLDFLRITPPEDDIIGDTPYYPKLECTVGIHKM
ncbi:hypothetical protein OJAV_G00212970 [Oryzias javanicus]|uniref:Uncharacterized protein n=1 Tax=Oryzias javanicus TaxID=123683 RepID=A0A437C3B7_ORYJA|nr:hypothetical protein OJAV_G00212970 [Oryzias javanicus]